MERRVFVSEYEPLDSCKKSHIEEDLVPGLDDAIVKTAKMRRKQPPKCRKVARKTANNVVQYYSRVHIKTDRSDEGQEKFAQENAAIWTEIKLDVLKDLNSMSSATMNSVAEERHELLKARRLCRGKEKPARGCARQRKFPKVNSAHFYNPDFIIDQNDIA
ncbi:uncharacterized protein LOC101845392 isoform X2 [Aplysia californica]|uniref:Uncharacterized protein LOC101845392 isoform X2 n=1 Tax=Aplysia californica TaxID=6500 RepID=A0ABM0ZW35_APLCA|nr:uncharacterized protein LOC101845392 isoform X2 [Aplysia californica]